MQVYRSVRLIIQNSSPVALSVEGGEVLQGGWASDDRLTRAGARIAPQSAASLTCTSCVLRVGCEAFLRLASVIGYVHLHWTLPWVGRFQLRHEADAREWTCERILYIDEPASPSVLVMLSPTVRGG